MTYYMKHQMYAAIRNAGTGMSDKQMVEYVNLTFGLCDEIVEIVTYTT